MTGILRDKTIDNEVIFSTNYEKQNFLILIDIAGRKVKTLFVCTTQSNQKRLTNEEYRHIIILMDL